MAFGQPGDILDWILIDKTLSDQKPKKAAGIQQDFIHRVGMLADLRP